MKSLFDKTLLLRDGRLLAYAEYGDPRGTPVFLFHGMPGSRIFRPSDEVTTKLGVRLITVDRPGYGLSTFQPHRRFLDWPEDVTALADSLNLDSFAVCGHSGGAPYVLACAYKIPERLSAAGVISGVGRADDPHALDGMKSTNRMGFLVGRYFPWPIWRLLIWMFYHRAREHPEELIKPDEKNPSNHDNIVFEDPSVLENCRASVREALRPGLRGHAWEGYIQVRPWGFKPEEIKMPVHLWHGEADVDASIGMARAVAASIPNCRAMFYPGEGHIFIFPRWEEILSTLIRPSI